MKVKDLIEKLKTLDQELPIVREIAECGVFYEIATAQVLEKDFIAPKEDGEVFVFYSKYKGVKNTDGVRKVVIFD